MGGPPAEVFTWVAPARHVSATSARFAASVFEVLALGWLAALLLSSSLLLLVVSAQAVRRSVRGGSSKRASA